VAGTIKHEWNGTILTITSDSGTSSADLKGATGDDGCRGPQGAAGTVIVNGCDLTEYATKEYVDGIATGGVSLDNYYTKAETDAADAANKKYVDDAITTLLTEYPPFLRSELENYYTKAETDAAISVAAPQKGIDYWTAAEQESIIQQVIAALGTPVFGSVDADKNIILTGELADGVYTLKYEDDEGNLTVIGTLAHNADTPNYTNVLPLSIDTDGSIYNGIGYMAAKRINSSHQVVDLQNTAATNPAFVSGLIPIKEGDTIRFKNCYIDATNVDKSSKYGFANWNGRICYYTAAKEWGNEDFWTSFTDNKSSTFATPVVGADGLCYELTFNNKITTAGYKYIRFNLAGTPETAIITINEPIV